MMKKIILTLVLLAACFPSVVLYADGILFENLTLPEARKKAAQEGKLVFVDCYIPSCGPCKYMARNVFPLDSCGEYMNPRFVSVMKDLEAEDNKYIVEEYNVRIFPTFLLLRPDGSLYSKIEGGAVKQAGLFISRIRQTLRMCEMNERYDAGCRDLSFMMPYTELLSVLDFRRLRNVLDDYIPALPTDSLISPHVNYMVGLMRTTDNDAFKCLYDNREALAKIDGGKELLTSLVGVYFQEFEYRKSNPSVDFAVRIAQLEQLDALGLSIPMFLKEKMLFRDVINKWDYSRIGALASAIELIGQSEEADHIKVAALRELRGLKRLTAGKTDDLAHEALQKVLPLLSETSRQQVTGSL